jgi:hypothetical protein
MLQSQLAELIAIAGSDRIQTTPTALACYAYDSSLDSQLNNYMPDVSE